MNFMVYKQWYAKLLKKQTNKMLFLSVFSPPSSNPGGTSRGRVRPEREKDANHILSLKV